MFGYPIRVSGSENADWDIRICISKTFPGNDSGWHSSEELLLSMHTVGNVCEESGIIWSKFLQDQSSGNIKNGLDNWEQGDHLESS